MTCLAAAPGESQRSCIVKYTPASELPNTSVMIPVRHKPEQLFEHNISVFQKYAQDNSPLNGGPFIAKRSLTTPHGGGLHEDKAYAKQVDALMAVAIEKAKEVHGPKVYTAAAAKESKCLTGNAVAKADIPRER